MSRACWLVVLTLVASVQVVTADEGWRPLSSGQVQSCNCEQTVTMRRPVVETALREEQFTVMQPTVAWQPQQVDQGRWVTNYVQQPGTERTRLRWVRGGWTTDAQTGQTFWRPGMLRPTKVQDQGPTTPVTTWQPQPVAVQMPVTSYTPVVQTRRVPVQTQRWVEEQQVQRIPGCVCSQSAPAQGQLTPIPRPELGPTEQVPESAAPPAEPSAGHELPPVSPPRIRWSDISRVAVLAPLVPLRQEH